MFKTTGTINAELLERFKKHLMPLPQRNFFILSSVICILLGLISTFINMLLLSMILFVGVLLLITEYIFCINHIFKITLLRIEENIGKKESSYNITFDETGLLTNNLDTGATTHIKYSAFVKIIKISNTYALFTKTNQLIIIYDDFLDNDQPHSFEEFIKEKCKNLKQILIN